jgi:hypothetical protein
MKKSTIYLTTLVLMIAFVLSSCDLVKDLLDINFDTSYKDIPFTVNPKNSGIYMFHKTYIQSDLKKDIEDNGGDISNLQNVEVSKGQIEVVSAGKTLDPFSWVKVYLRAPSDKDSTLVASASVANTGETLVNMDVEPISLNDILEQEEYVVSIVGELDQDLQDAIDMVVRLMYEVTVTP